MLAAERACLLGALLAGRARSAALVVRRAATSPALRLMLVNTFLIAFTFVPFHVMRMQNEAVTYSAFTFARSAGHARCCGSSS